MTHATRTRRSRRRLVLVLPLAALALLASATTAWAAWSTTGTGGSGGAAVTVPQGATPMAAVAGTSVTLTWAATDLRAGVAVQGYTVTRVNAATGGQGTVGPGCSGIVTSTTCTETGVPTGSWSYSVTPVQDSWSGPASTTVTVTVGPT